MGSTWGFSSLMKTPHVKFFEFLHEVTSTKICQVIVLSKIFFQDFRAEQCQNGPKMSLFTFYEKLFRLFCIKLQIDFNDFLERILDLRFFGPKGAQKGVKITFFIIHDFFWFFWMKLQQHNDRKLKWMIFLAKYIWFFALTQIIFRGKVLYQVFLWKGGQKWACLVILFRVWFFIRNLPYDN